MALVALWDFENDQSLVSSVGDLTLVNSGPSPTGFTVDGLEIVSGSDDVGVDITSLGLTEGVLFIAAMCDADTSFKTAVSITDDGLGNTHIVEIQATNAEAPACQVLNNSLTQFNNNFGGVWSPTVSERCAIAFKDNEFQSAFEGTTSALDSVGTVPTLGFLHVGIRAVAGTPWNGNIQKVALYSAVTGDESYSDRALFLTDVTSGVFVPTAPEVVADRGGGGAGGSGGSGASSGPGTNAPGSMNPGQGSGQGQGKGKGRSAPVLNSNAITAGIEVVRPNAAGKPNTKNIDVNRPFLGSNPSTSVMSNHQRIGVPK